MSSPIPLMTTYLRWKTGEPRLGRPIVHDDPEHPVMRYRCPGCGTALAGPRPVRLVALGPDDEAAELCHRAGGWYAASAVVVHADCVDDHLLAEQPDTVDAVTALLRRLSRAASD